MLDLLPEQTTFFLWQEPMSIFLNETTNTYEPLNIYKTNGECSKA